ncbi:hypothetical protein MUK72_19415 (plasmid) [Halococcus dombrowskii]|uniref:Halobacterial output domain-containing protein n=1 Tax=Halococcus dombrowskii TaxID=179637 RepID=A0AAV3SIM0_HALDO|nr:hypothetical protein [Halococcus dombrowskii]UOO97320.1 hypothetical protein MUK72_19415 [Halococcus dombrowskii]
MTTNAISGQEPDESDADQQPTTEADAETVHATDEWALVVRRDGAVEARTHWPNGDPQTFTTAPIDEAPDSSATYRYGLSIEQVLSRYTHETRFDRDLNARENGAAFRRGIIDALCALAPTTFPDGSDGQPVGIVFVNAPTGPSTTVVNEDASADGTYATFYPFETASESTTGEDR